MKVNQEQFNKLKQLDRIEFRQKYGNIDKIELSFSNGYILLIGIISMLLFIMSIITENPNIVNTGILILKMGILIGVLNIILSIVDSCYKHKLISKLESEYFEVKKLR